MIKSISVSQLYKDNIKLTNEIYKRDLLIKLLMSRLEHKIERKENSNGRK